MSSKRLLLGDEALADNLYLKQAEVHGMSQRGGDVMSGLRLSSHAIASDLIPQGKADLIVSLEPMEALRYARWLKPEGWIVTNSVPVLNIPNYPEMEKVEGELRRRKNTVVFDMDAAAAEVATARASNMVLLGAASRFIDLPEEKIAEGIKTVFGPKGEKVVESNLRAFRKGREEAMRNS